MRFLSLALVGCASDAAPIASAPLETPADALASVEPPPAPAPTEIVAASAPAEPPAAAPAGEVWRFVKETPVWRRASKSGAQRGILGKNASFRVLEHLPGDSSCKDWAKLEADGFTCLDGAERTEEPPVHLPTLVSYDPPRPEEYWTYVETNSWDRTTPEALVPNVYARRFKQWKGPLYRSVEAFERGDPSIGSLPYGGKYQFIGLQETSKGPVAVHEDGRVAPVEQLYLYPISRHAGRDLERDPLPEGRWPAFAIDYEDTKIWPSPAEGDEGTAPRTVPYHTPLEIRSTPADPSGHWWEIPDALGPGVAGYVNDLTGIRRPVPAPRPEGVGADELWYDVDLDQQVLMGWRGDQMVYFTLVATGEEGNGSPRGLYQITDKMVTTVMASRPDSADPYYVEGVPWTLHFRPRYALHAAYWHWGYGRTASHGCINLSPTDARILFDRASPAMPDGWRTIFATEADRPTPFRVRRGEEPVADRRSEFPVPR